MSDPLDPWERQPDETPRAYAAFRQYRDLGPTRTVEKLQDVARTSAERWSARHRWVDRANAWDVERWREDDAERLERIRSMDETHMRAARVMITAGLRALAEQPKLSPHQAARLVDLGTRLERAALLGEHLPPAPIGPAVVDDVMSPLERIARELSGTA